MQRGLPLFRLLASRTRFHGNCAIPSLSGPFVFRDFSRSVSDPKPPRDHHQQQHQPQQGLQPTWEVVRMASENSYLSWCRNGYLCTVLALSLHAHEGFISELSAMAFILATYNMAMGTGGYMYNMTLHRPYTGSSRTSNIFLTSMIIGHFLIWGFTFMVFIGYADEDDEPFDDDKE